MIGIKIIGLEQLQRKCKGSVLLSMPLRRAFSRSVLHLESEAKVRAPVDTGRLRSSITHAVDSQVMPLWGKIGTNVAYAPYVEFGARPHWPPTMAMQPWASRHGFTAGKGGAFLVARAIARRGTKGRLMFTKAMKASRNAIQGYFELAAREIEQIWRQG